MPGHSASQMKFVVLQNEHVHTSMHIKQSSTPNQSKVRRHKLSNGSSTLAIKGLSRSGMTERHVGQDRRGQKFDVNKSKITPTRGLRRGAAEEVTYLFL